MVSLKEAEFLGWYMGDGCISVTNKYHEFTITGDIKEEFIFYCFKRENYSL